MPLKPNRIYRHKRKGTLYLLTALTNVQAEDPVKFPPMAVYVDEQNRTWSRPVAEFEENFEFQATVKMPEYFGFSRLFTDADRALTRQYYD